MLSELGEQPGPATAEACYNAFVTTKSMLSRYTSEQILGLKQATDSKKLAAMEIIQHILVAVFNSPDPHMGVLLVTKLICLSLEHGLSEASSFAFAMYSTMLAHGALKDLESSYVYGKLSLDLLAVLGSKKYKARVFTMVYGLVNILRDPFQASLPKLLEAYQVGCEGWDIEYAFRSTHIYAEIALFTGQGLGNLQHELRMYARRALQCKQLGAELAILPYLATAIELSGDSEKECVYKAFLDTTEEALFQQLESRHDRRVRFSMLNSKKIVHIFNGDMDSACRVHESILNDPIISSNMEHIRSMPNIFGQFVDGLLAFSCARKNCEDRQEWVKKGEGVLEAFKEYALVSKWNFESKLYLLQAECYFLQEDGMALEKYEASIASAKKSRFVHEEGLSCYLLGKYHLAHNCKDKARKAFSDAKACYERWGASALVRKLDDLLLAL